MAKIEVVGNYLYRKSACTLAESWLTVSSLQVDPVSIHTVLWGVVTWPNFVFSVQCRHSCCPFDKCVEMLMSLLRCEEDPTCLFWFDYGLPLLILCRRCVSVETLTKVTQQVDYKVVDSERLGKCSGQGEYSRRNLCGISERSSHGHSSIWGTGTQEAYTYCHRELWREKPFTHSQTFIHGYIY